MERTVLYISWQCQECTGAEASCAELCVLCAYTGNGIQRYRLRADRLRPDGCVSRILTDAEHVCRLHPADRYRLLPAGRSGRLPGQHWTADDRGAADCGTGLANDATADRTAAAAAVLADSTASGHLARHRSHFFLSPVHS